MTQWLVLRLSIQEVTGWIPENPTVPNICYKMFGEENIGDTIPNISKLDHKNYYDKNYEILAYYL